MANERQAIAALDTIETILGGRSSEGQGPGGIANSAICSEYAEIRRHLDIALTLIERIPVYGRKIALAFHFLMQVADAHCAGLSRNAVSDRVSST